MAVTALAQPLLRDVGKEITYVEHWVAAGNQIEIDDRYAIARYDYLVAVEVPVNRSSTPGRYARRQTTACSEEIFDSTRMFRSRTGSVCQVSRQKLDFVGRGVHPKGSEFRRVEFSCRIR